MTLAAVIAAEPSLSPAQVTAAFDAVIGTGAALRHLAIALAIDPDALCSGAPPVAGRLATALVAAGSSMFALPACARCGRTGWPLRRNESGHGVCDRCRAWQGATGCFVCGRTKPVAARTRQGLPMCERCRRHRQGQRRCGMCGTVAAIAVTGRDGQPDVCVGCYRLPDAVCARCGQTRPCNSATHADPVCKACADRSSVRCAHCGHDRPATARWPEGPVCERCYRAALARRGPCDGCGRPRRLVDPPGPLATRCATCAGTSVPGGHRCGGCGIEDRLFERGRCARCTLTRRATRLLAGDQPDVSAHLIPLRDAIAATPQPYSALNWLRQGAAAILLAEVAAGRLALTHQALNTPPPPASNRRVRVKTFYAYHLHHDARFIAWAPEGQRSPRTRPTWTRWRPKLDVKVCRWPG